MTREQIIEGLKEILRAQKQFRGDVQAIDQDSKLAGLGFDSLSILDFIYDVEDRFQVETEMGDLVQMEVVGDLVTYIESRVNS